MNKHVSIGWWISSLLAGSSIFAAFALIFMSSQWAVVPVAVFGASCLWGGVECAKAAMRAQGMLPPLALLLALTLLPQARAFSAEPPPKPRVVAYVCCLDGCPPCKRMEREIPRELVPQGWRVVVDNGAASVADAQVFISKRKPKGVTLRAYPTTIIFCDGKEVERHAGYWSAKELAAAYKSAEER